MAAPHTDRPRARLRLFYEILSRMVTRHSILVCGSRLLVVGVSHSLYAGASFSVPFFLAVHHLKLWVPNVISARDLAGSTAICGDLSPQELKARQSMERDNCYISGSMRRLRCKEACVEGSL
ncbi:hypothetical protein BDW67DRAFT_41762 [Aspergillus spinulosporus]